VLLAGFATLLIIVFDAQVTALIQLYILGVFISFTLSQTGMVRHWARILRSDNPPKSDVAARRRIRRSQAINFVGACLTGAVLVLVLITKFTHGAWIVCLAIPIIFATMRGIRRHYDRVAVELQPEPGPPTLPSRVRAVVLVSKIHAPTLRALAYAKASRPHSLVAVTVAVDPEESDRLRAAWAERGITIDLVVLASPYREVTRPVLEYVARTRRESPRDVVAVYVPEYVVGRWWEHLLHNQSALRLKTRLRFQPGVMITSVPWQLASSERAEQRLERTGAGAGAVRQGLAGPPGPAQRPTEAGVAGPVVHAAAGASSAAPSGDSGPADQIR
jgi:hypothetical protein